jgi:hypothetical protein
MTATEPRAWDSFFAKKEGVWCLLLLLSAVSAHAYSIAVTGAKFWIDSIVYFQLSLALFDAEQLGRLYFGIRFSLSARDAGPAAFDPGAEFDLSCAPVARIGGHPGPAQRIGRDLLRSGLQGQARPAGAIGRGDGLRPSPLFRRLPRRRADGIGIRFASAFLPCNCDPCARWPAFLPSP